MMEVLQVGVAQTIVDTLSRYRRNIPVDFLAQMLGKNVPELMTYVTALEEKGVVDVDTEGQTIRLKR